MVAGITKFGVAQSGGSGLFARVVVGLLVFRGGLLGLLWAVGGEPLQPDSPLYLQLAAGLATHGWFSASADVYLPEVFRTPGYPWFLVPFHELGLEGLVWPLLAQELLYLGTVAVFF